LQRWRFYWNFAVPYLGANLRARINEIRLAKCVKMNKSDLEERLIKFAVLIIAIAESTPNTRSANHLSGQLLRSGTSPALNYGEAQSAESRNDFVHKIKIVLKELRETFVCLLIIYRSNFFKAEDEIQSAIKEADELIAIFVKSAQTAMKNNQESIETSKIKNR
jgi:four helix bundle protein